MNKTNKQPLNYEDIARIVQDETDKFFAETSEAAIRAEVRRVLEVSKKDLMFKVLGFDSRYGRWEIDHCNGRMSALKDVIHRAATEEFSKWVEENMCARQLKLSTSQKEALVKEYNDALFRHARERIRQVAPGRVQSIIKEALAEAKGPVVNDEVWMLLAGKGDDE